MNPTWTQNDLQEDSKTLLYEFGTLCEIARHLSTSAIPGSRVSNNAHVESFAIHSRALLCFFFGQDTESGFSCRKTDVLATRFFNESDQWAVQWSQHTPLVDHAKQQADKHVAHITTHRRGVNHLGGAESIWQLGQIAQMFVRLMTAFLDTVPKGNLAPGVEDKLWELIEQSQPTQTKANTPSEPAQEQNPSHPTTVERPVTNVRIIAPNLTAKTCPPDNPKE